VSVTIPGYDSLTWYIVVLQNNTQFGFALLDPEGLWLYGFGELSAQNQSAGPLIDPFGNLQIGQFSLQFGDGSVSGTITFADEVPLSVSGARFF
jgi:hypothetical protein